MQICVSYDCVYELSDMQICQTLNNFVGIAMVVLTGLWFHIYDCICIDGARCVKNAAL